MGKYELIRQLAAGGMAEVFLAKAAGPMGFEKTVVVKRILPHLASDPLFVEMFLSEAKLAAQLNHPNVVQIFDFGEAEGTYFLAMEYIDGPDLRRLSTKAYEVGNPIPFALCAKILSYACEGLAYAHGYADPETGQPMDLVHRDISPDNIILAKNGAVKVVDFGIAKAAMQLHKTQPGFLKGKLGYMSPEYLNGKPVDCRADVYALGVVLYELVSNKRPYEAESEIALLHAMMFEPMTPVRDRRSDIPGDLETVINRALSRKPEDRYPSCVELQADLERFIVSVGEPLSAVHLSQLVAELQPGGNDAQGAPAAKTPSRAKPVRTPAPGPAPVAKTPAPRQVASPKVEQPEEVKPEEAPPAVEPSSEPTLHMTLEELLAEQARLAGGSSKPAATPKPAPKKAESGSRPKVEEPSAQTPAPKAPERKTTKTGASGEKKKSQPPRASTSRSNPSLKAKRLEEPKNAPPAPTRSRMTLIAAAVAGVVLLGGGVALVIGSGSKKADPPPPAANTVTEKEPVVPTGDAHSSNEPDSITPEPVENPTPTPTPRPKAPPAPNPSLATLKITTNVPAAKVRIGKKQGLAPYTASLMPGKYNVELVDKGTNLLLKTVSFEVKAGEKRNETITLQKGTLLLNSLPEATVYVDSKSLGTTPAKVEIFEGKHHVRFVCPQKPQPYEEDAIVEPGKQIRVVGKCK